LSSERLDRGKAVLTSGSEHVKTRIALDRIVGVQNRPESLIPEQVSLVYAVDRCVAAASGVPQEVLGSAPRAEEGGVQGIQRWGVD
jgi:hypothetical protein